MALTSNSEFLSCDISCNNPLIIVAAASLTIYLLISYKLFTSFTKRLITGQRIVGAVKTYSILTRPTTFEMHDDSTGNEISSLSI